MTGNTVTLVNPDDPKHTKRDFTFDHAYWSHDGYKLRADGYAEGTDEKYVDQVRKDRWRPIDHSVVL